jgi:hypothetical protein
MYQQKRKYLSTIWHIFKFFVCFMRFVNLTNFVSTECANELTIRRNWRVQFKRHGLERLIVMMPWIGRPKLILATNRCGISVMHGCSMADTTKHYAKSQALRKVHLTIFKWRDLVI